MKIKKDGSVFRIELDSRHPGYETRISFAVNVHEELRRPRIEVSQQGLLGLFMEILPHIKGEEIVGDEDLAFQSKSDSVDALARIMGEVAAYHVATQIIHPDWRVLVSMVNVLVEKLARKPASLKSGYHASPGGILNAYREGDLTFDEAVGEITARGERNR